MEKVRRDPASLSQLVKDFDLEVVYKGLDYDTRMITIPDVNRPALQLVGFYDYFEPKRLQILGKAEFTFLKAMPLEQRRKVFEDLLRCEIPALIVARNMEIFPELMEIARKHGRTLLRTEKTTVELTSHIIDYLNRALAPQITRHGVLVDVYGEGVLLMGESGVGKSETAVELVKRGHRLVADDAVEIRETNHGTLEANAPELIRHYMELRGIGVIDVRRLFGMGALEESMTVSVTSFGFKYGIPIDADLVFDVRFLPNPYYIAELKECTGLEEAVRAFLFGYRQTTEFMRHLEELFAFLLPQYVEEGKSSLVIAVGCTGGHHRSVAVAHALTEFIRQKGYRVEETHRDISQ